MLAIVNALGILLTLFSGLFALPILWSIVVHDGTAVPFLVSAALTALPGLMLFRLTRSHRREVRRRDGFALATLAWLLTSAAAAVPLLIMLPDLSFTDAFFE